LGAGVVGHIQPRFCLDHFYIPNLYFLFAGKTPAHRNQSWTRHPHCKPLAALQIGQILTPFAKRSPPLCLKKWGAATSF
ncbi:MAG: hypothetical protein ACOVQO_00035, partial [Limnohabitans sp.]